jgi:hypothetical protein
LFECKCSWAYSLNFFLLFSTGTCLQTLWLAITRKYQLHLSKVCITKFFDINFLVYCLDMSKHKSTFDVNNNLFWTLIFPTVAWFHVWVALLVLIKVSWKVIYFLKIVTFSWLPLFNSLPTLFAFPCLG